jgi:mRNA interferase MazF
MIIKRGDIVLANLEPVYGSEQGKIRPCLIVQNDVSNRFSPTTIIAPLTSKVPKKEYPVVVIIDFSESGLKEKSTILCNQIRAISVEDRIIKRIATVSPSVMKRVDDALKVTLELI